MQGTRPLPLSAGTKPTLPFACSPVPSLVAVPLLKHADDAASAPEPAPMARGLPGALARKKENAPPPPKDHVALPASRPAQNNADGGHAMTVRDLPHNLVTNVGHKSVAAPREHGRRGELAKTKAYANPTPPSPAPQPVAAAPKPAPLPASGVPAPLLLPATVPPVKSKASPVETVGKRQEHVAQIASGVPGAVAPTKAPAPLAKPNPAPEPVAAAPKPAPLPASGAPAPPPAPEPAPQDKNKHNRADNVAPR